MFESVSYCHLPHFNIMKKYYPFVFLLLAFLCFTAEEALAQNAAMEFPGRNGQWNGFANYEFSLDTGKFGQRPCRVVCPKEPAAGNPWVWRAVFFGHEPQTEIAMLNKGYYIAWIGCTDLVGSPENVQQRNAFYKFLTEKGLGKKPLLLGMSRGGICSMNWAIANPDSVTAIYIDNPVMDFKSWPGGILPGKSSPSDWQSVLNSYHLTDAQAREYRGNPVDSFATLAEKKIPVLLVCGDSDSVVPFEVNGKVFMERYKAAGGPVELILKPGNDHHPHSLKDPAPIVDFYLKAAGK